MSLDTWIEYKSIYGNTLFIYNKATGEHKWPSEDGGSNLQDNIMHGLPIMAKEYCCIATQTDDYGCENGCSSKYINTSNVIENAGPLNNINSVSSVDVDNTTASCSNENYNNQQGSMTVSDSEDVSNETNVEKPIECSQLSQEFEVEQDLTQHEQTSCVEESIKCSYCKRVFNYKDELDSHLQLHFPVDKRYKCPHCNKKCASNSALKIHIRQHTGEKPFECSFCNKKFRQKGHLSDHLKIHTGIKPHVCIYCEKGFARRNVLKKHMAIHMDMNAVSNSDTSTENQQPVAVNVDKNMASCSTENADTTASCSNENYNNQQGSMTVSDSEDVSNKTNLENPVECAQRSRQFEVEQDFTQHEQTSCVEESIKCSYCKKVFRHKDELDSHLQLHFPVDKRYKCPHCNKKCASNGALKIHTRQHTGEKPFECSVCNKKFRQKGHLSDHLKIHTGIKPHVCIYCKKGFARRNVLKKHMAIHMDMNAVSNSDTSNENENLQPVSVNVDKNIVSCSTENAGNQQDSSPPVNYHKRDPVSMEKFLVMPFECTQCNQQFYLEQDLNRHERLHNAKKVFECSHCNKRFYHKGHLHSHLRVHNVDKPYKCPHCDKQYVSNNNLKIHLRRHTGEKPFECSVCSKTFTQRGHLSDHLKIHTGIKPHECFYCKKGFARRSALRKHMANHIG